MRKNKLTGVCLGGGGGRGGNGGRDDRGRGGNGGRDDRGRGGGGCGGGALDSSGSSG